MRCYDVHETSIIGVNSKIGNGTKIWQFCNIMDDAIIGRNCMLGQNVYIESGVVIGNHVKIKNNVALYTGVECEDDVFFGPGCVFTNVINPRSSISKKKEFQKTIIHIGATIGANATILCGNKIGKYAMIGAGSVVTKDVPDYALVIGNPARIIGYVCECGERLHEDSNLNDLRCTSCNKNYIYKDEIVIRKG